jgi:hypothetical protein
MKTFRIIEAIPCYHYYEYVVQAETEDDALEIVSYGMGVKSDKDFILENHNEDPIVTIKEEKL